MKCKEQDQWAVEQQNQTEDMYKSHLDELGSEVGDLRDENSKLRQKLTLIDAKVLILMRFWVLKFLENVGLEFYFGIYTCPSFKKAVQEIENYFNSVQSLKCNL